MLHIEIDSQQGRSIIAERKREMHRLGILRRIPRQVGRLQPFVQAELAMATDLLRLPWLSRELLDEWQWSERFAAQPETERYLNFVADKFDLRRHMQFGCRVEAMTFDENTDGWTVRLDEVGSLQLQRVAGAGAARS